MGTEFQFTKMKIFLDMSGGLLHNSVNVLSELYTKLGTMITFKLCIFYHNFCKSES